MALLFYVWPKPEMKKRNEKVICVTFPRSGHHLFARILAKYFSRDLYDGYVKKSTKHFVAGTFCYCEYYRHCKSSPCSDVKTNFQKNHDFEGSLPNTRLLKYIIQYRTPVESLISNFEFDIKNSKRPNEIEEWEKFASYGILYWKKFVNKW